MLHGDSILVDRIKQMSGPGTTVETSQEAYDNWAPTYEDELLGDGYKAPRIASQYACNTITRENRSAVRVLDVGAGTGLAAKEMRKEGFQHIDALEPNETMLDLARKQNLYNNYFVEYLTGSPCSLPENSYDVLVGSGVYAAAGHLPCDAICEMIRLVKPGGHIILVTRAMLITKDAAYKDLEPSMDRLEAQGKWKKIKRDIKDKFYLEFDAIVWQYQKL